MTFNNKGNTDVLQKKNAKIITIKIRDVMSFVI